MAENVLDRLKRMTRIARQHGFDVRGEPLDGAGCGWCEIRGQRVLFLDLSQPASEQISAIREILEAAARIRPHLTGPDRAACQPNGPLVDEQPQQIADRAM